MFKSSLPSELTLVIDQGGHATRALVFAADGSLRAHAVQEVKTAHPAVDQVEHDPEELLGSIDIALTRVARLLGDDLKRVTQAGLATQRSTIACWDKFTGEALSPVISWQDRRAHAWLARYAPHAATVHRATGLFLSPHYGVSKLRWCLDHNAKVADAYRARRLFFGPLASFLLFRLVALRPFVTDPVNASRTLLSNIRTLQWDKSLLELFAVPGECLPRTVPNYHDFGLINFAGRRIPIRFVTGDQSAALFAQGVPRPRTAYVNVGTGAFVQRPIGEQLFYHPKMLTGVVLQGEHVNYALEGTVNGAGSALRWVAEELSLNFIDQHLPEWLGRPQEPPLFLNGVSGLGAPFWLPRFPSRFIGPGESWQKAVAVLESIVFLLQANLEELNLEHDVTDIAISGGIARLDGFCQRLADLSGLKVNRADMHEASARGMSFLLSTARKHWVATVSARDFTPRPNAAFKARYERWRAEMNGAVVTERRALNPSGSPHSAT